jgi:hypothetical protein
MEKNGVPTRDNTPIRIKNVFPFQVGGKVVLGRCCINSFSFSLFSSSEAWGIGTELCPERFSALGKQCPHVYASVSSMMCNLYFIP